MAEERYFSADKIAETIDALLESPYADSTDGSSHAGVRDALKLMRDAIQGSVPESMQIEQADVRPVVHAKWTSKSTASVVIWGTCGNCGKIKPVDDFCGGCGADMRENAGAARDEGSSCGL